MIRFFAAVLAAAVCVGCSSGTRETSDVETLAHRPAAYRPDQFPDIPFERLVGYRLTTDDPQVAIAIAGGSLRRLSVVYITRQGDEPKPAQEEIDRITGGLTPYGWHQVSADPGRHESRFTKGRELLVVRASTESSATTIEFRLEPVSK